MIVFSHPRSGSTQFLNVLKRTFSNVVPESQIFILGEFFNVWNAGSFGNLASLLAEINLSDSRVEIKGRTRQLSITAHELVNHNLFRHDQDYQEMSNLMFSDVIFHFKSISDLCNFIFNELENRYNFYQDLKKLDYLPIIKHFFYYPLVLKDRNLIVDRCRTFDKKLVENQNVVFYRKNFRSAVLSSLIKTYYYDLDSLKKEGFSHRVDQAHNYGNMDPLIPKNISIEKNIFDIVIDPFVEFDNFVKQNSNLDIITFEQLFSDNNKTIIKFLDRDLIAERFIKNQSTEEEIPMNYISDKEDYFLNISDFDRYLNNLSANFFRYL